MWVSIWSSLCLFALRNDSTCFCFAECQLRKAMYLSAFLHNLSFLRPSIQTDRVFLFSVLIHFFGICVWRSVDLLACISHHCIYGLLLLLVPLGRKSSNCVLQHSSFDVTVRSHVCSLCLQYLLYRACLCPHLVLLLHISTSLIEYDTLKHQGITPITNFLIEINIDNW